MAYAGPWETVHTVNDFFDVPRLGVADFRGAPHVYSCVFNPTADEWTSTYRLSPISPAQLALMLEDWEIWSRWQSAYHAETLTERDNHPALFLARVRHEELGPDVARILNANEGIVAVPTFRGSMYPHALEVSWASPPNVH